MLSHSAWCVLGSLILFLSPGAAWAFEEVERTLLWQQPSLHAVSGRVFTNVDRGFDENPPDYTKLERHLRRQLGRFHTAIWDAPVKGRKLEKHLSWNLGSYTGLSIAGPRWRYERGVGADVPGSSAVQVVNDQVGVLNNPSSVTQAPITWAGAGSSFEEDDYTDVWGMPNQGLAISLDAQIPSMSGFRQDATGYFIPYSNLSPQLLDRTTGTRLWLLVQLYDARGFQGFDGYQPTEGLGVAEDCPDHACDKVIVATSFLPGMTYGTFDDSTSARATGSTWSGYRHFELVVTYDQLQQSLLDAQALGMPLSTDPSDYSIVAFALANEIASHGQPAPPDAHLGLSFRKMKLERVIFE